MDRWQKCLQGKALQRVICKPNTKKFFHTVKRILEILKVSSNVILNALVYQIRRSPTEEVEKPDTVVTFAMKFCKTLKAAQIESNLNNPSLLLSFDKEASTKEFIPNRMKRNNKFQGLHQSRTSDEPNDRKSVGIDVLLTKKM